MLLTARWNISLLCCMPSTHSSYTVICLILRSRLSEIQSLQLRPPHLHDLNYCIASVLLAFYYQTKEKNLYFLLLTLHLTTALRPTSLCASSLLLTNQGVRNLYFLLLTLHLTTALRPTITYSTCMYHWLLLSQTLSASINVPFQSKSPSLDSRAMNSTQINHYQASSHLNYLFNYIKPQKL